jgi:hypothetical protein
MWFFDGESTYFNYLFQYKYGSVMEHADVRQYMTENIVCPFSSGYLIVLCFGFDGFSLLEHMCRNATTQIQPIA